MNLSITTGKPVIAELLHEMIQIGRNHIVICTRIIKKHHDPVIVAITSPFRGFELLRARAARWPVTVYR